LAYTGFELVGAALAAGLYRVCRPDDFQEEEMTEYPLYSRLCSEFLGTYILILTVGLNVLGGSPAGAFSIAASLMCMIFALGTCSGAHFNPAVTVAIILAGRDKCSITDGAAYIGVQLVGGVCAGLTYMVMEKGKTFPLGPQKGFGWGEAAAAEVVFTFVLCFVVLSVATTKAGLSQYFGLAIGMCVTVGGCAIGAVSGGSLNPAVSVGISTSHAMNGGASVFWHCGAYAAAEFVGAALAAGTFMVCHKAEYESTTEENEKLTK